MLLKILVDGDPVLRKISKPVTQFDATLATLAKNMIETMYSATGVGLAAPQVNQSIRMVVSDWSDDRNLPLVWVNPEIVPVGKKMQCGEEGCLSVPGYLGQVERFEKIKIKAQTLNGKGIETELEGFPAVVLQHEVDHLNGILYIDKAISDLEKVDVAKPRRKRAV